MQQFIDLAVQQLGIGADDAKTATGGIMSLLKDQLEKGQFDEVAAAIPGAEDLISKFGGESSGGGLLGMASSLLGGSGGAMGGAAAIAGILSKTDLDAGQLSSFGDLLINYLKENIGDLAGAKINDILPALLSKNAA